MWNYQKGHMKEIPLAGGVLSLTGTFNPLELDGEERTLVFAVVALSASSACVLVMPCGRSAHLELGHANGAGKPTAILLSDGEPELMYGMADLVTDSLDEIESWVAARIPWGLMAKTVRAEPTDG